MFESTLAIDKFIIAVVDMTTVRIPSVLSGIFKRQMGHMFETYIVNE